MKQFRYINGTHVLVLIVGLLFAQWVALTHVHNQSVNTADSVCSVCLAGEQLGHAVTTMPAISVAVASNIEPINIAVSQHPFLTASHYRPRAPPVFL